MRTSRLLLGPMVLFGIVTVLSCTAQPDVAASLPPSPDRAGWLVVESNDSLRIELDTAGLKWHVGRAPVWVGFSDVRGERAGLVAAPFLRFETHQDLNCMMRIARGIESRIPDSTGKVRLVPIADTSWRLFDDHPVGETLRAVCRAMRQP